MKRFMGVLVSFLFILGFTASVHATPVEFTESFLSGGDSFTVWEGYSAAFAFNLTENGDFASLVDNRGNTIATVAPNPDETDFVPGEYSITDASLDFTFSSADRHEETITVRAGMFDGNTKIGEKEFDLGYWFFGNHREYASLSLDLIDLGLADFLADGKFVSVVIAFDAYSGWFSPDNDFRIDEASLTVKAEPVPEPGTMILLGLGLVGLAGMSRKKLFNV